MVRKIRLIGLPFLFVLLCLFVAGGVTDRMDFVAFGYDEPHDTGHATSDEDDSDEDNPGDDDNEDEDEDPVELLTGNFKYEYEDLSFLSGKDRMQLIRYYNSQDRYNGAVGYGWNFNYNMKAIPVTDEGRNYVIVRDFTGVRYKFQENADGSYQSPQGWFLDLTKDVDGGYILTDSCGLTYLFDAEGDLIQIKDCCSSTEWNLTYDTNKRLIKVEDTYGGSFSFSYNDVNKISSVEDHAGNEVFYFYNQKGELKEVVGKGGEIYRYAYDEDHNLTAILNSQGQTILENTYNDEDRVSKQTNRNGTFTFSYDIANRRVTVTNEDGKSRIHKMNEYGQPLEITDENGKTEYYTWNEQHRLTEYTNKLGETIKFEYDESGNRTKTIMPDGGEIVVEYDSSGNLLSLTDPTGAKTVYSYDGGRLTKKTYPSGQRYRGLTYDQQGRVRGIYDASSSPEQPTYELYYTDSGRVEHVVYPNNLAETFTYNEAGKVRKWVTRAGQEIFYRYDQAGRMDRVSYKVGAAYALYDYQYDEYGRLKAIVYPNGESMKFDLDKYGRTVRVTDPLGNSTEYTYSKGNLVKRTDGEGRITEYTYDATGRRTGVAYLAGDGSTISSISYTYDAMGRLSSADDGTVAVTFTYNFLGKPTKMECPYLQKTVDYSYDSAGRLIRTVITDHSSGDVTYTNGYAYDEDGLLTNLIAPSGVTTTIQYDEAARPVATAYPNGVEQQQSYTAMGLAENIDYKKGTDTLESFDYSFDDFGNVTRVVGSGVTTTYKYDDLNRLIEANSPDGSVIEYTYDLSENRTSKTVDGEAANFTYDKAGRLIEADGVTYDYDKNGNLIRKISESGVTTTYQYDYENRLTGVTLGDGTEIAYRYYPVLPEEAGEVAPLGDQVIAKTVNGSDGARYLVGQDMDLLLTMGSDNSFKAWHSGGVRKDDIVFSAGSGTTTYYLKDILSSVIGQADETGSMAKTLSYAPYGAVTPQDHDVFGFTGRYHEKETGLIYYRARFYDPEIGRFMTSDDFDRTLFNPRESNLYVYAMNNPTNYTDPTGYSAECKDGAWTGTQAGGEAHFVLGASVTVTTVCCTTSPSLCCSFFSLAGSAGLEASASGGGMIIQFLNCPTAGDIAGWGGGVSGEIALGGGIDVGGSVGTTGCVAVAGGGGVGVGGGVSVDFGYTWNTGCTD